MEEEKKRKIREKGKDRLTDEQMLGRQIRSREYDRRTNTRQTSRQQKEIGDKRQRIQRLLFRCQDTIVNEIKIHTVHTAHCTIPQDTAR